MARQFSPQPGNFLDDRERDYWHMAQNIAFRAGAQLVERDGASWLVTGAEVRMICEPQKRLWFATWRKLHDEYPSIRWW
jgi:hypothetical protein